MHLIKFLTVGLILGTGITLNAPLAASQTAGKTLDEKAVREIVIKTLREKPEIVLDALRQLEARAQKAKAKETLASNAADIFNHKDDPVGGNLKGNVTLVEFFDYQCGFCKRVHPAVAKLLKEDGNIRYVYKEFPILGQASMLASRAALAAKRLGSYHKFSSALMESRGALNAERIFSIAKSSGLDPDKLKAEIENGAESGNQIIRRNYKLAEALGINGTPAFVVGDQILRGAPDYDTLKSVIAKARKSKSVN